MMDVALDIRTLSFVTVLFASLSGVGLILVSWAQRAFTGLKCVGIGFLCVAAGFELIGLRHYIPTVWSIIISNASILGGFVLMNTGICRLRTIPDRYAVFNGIVLLGNLAVFLQYTYEEPSVAARIVSISLSLCLLGVVCCINVLTRKRATSHFAQRFVAFGFILFSGFMLLRALAVLYSGPLADFMAAGTIHTLAFIAILGLCLHVLFGLLWLTSAMLQEELQKHERIVSTSPDYIMLINRDGAYVLANDAALELLERNRETVVGNSSRELFGEHFYKSVTLPNIEKAFQGEAGQVSTWVDLPSGKRFLTVNYNPVAGGDGKISFVAINARDITAFQLIQKERQRIFDMSLDMLCIMDMNVFLKEVSPAWERVLGWKIEEIMQTSWLDIVHLDDIQATIDLKRTLASGTQTMDFVNRCRTKDGSYRFISWAAHPDLASRLIYAVGHDVTERKALEDELKRQTLTAPLTGAGNRRLFMQSAAEEIGRSVRYNTPLSLSMLDIDHFRRHPACSLLKV